MAKKLADFVQEAMSGIQQISCDDLEEMQEERGDLLIVDVREAWEYENAHIPNAILVPRGTLEGAADPNYKHRDHILCVAHARPIVLYCQTGGRSAMATNTLNQMGFTEVYNLAGGIEVWEAEDLPLMEGALID